ncbi:hypothetical protein DYB30_002983 [Aphanomyces astaci]|uniref:phosphoglycerate mutase (2,3-diphosphoglycerate-dependent) n=1 Tax=Aphanomyces astaci TaxID=112090 RepID=A0A397CPE6_APHAT|nr:hypothetical protein DYB30_002983 [Aphanomyces astaci]
MLVLMRHGQSVWNRKPARPDFVWRYAGTVDIPLSEVGMQEALEAGHALQHIPLDLVFCSQMDRARTTVAIALSSHDSGKTPVVVHSSPLSAPVFDDLVEPHPTRFVLPVYVTSALNERHFGSLQGVPSTQHPPDIGGAIRNDYRLKFPGDKGERVPLLYAFEKGVDEDGGRLVPVVTENRRARARSIARSLSKDNMVLDT